MTEKEFEFIILSVEDNVATITLNRPEKRNAMSPKLMEEFAEALEEAEKNEEVRAIVISGAGKAFCAGGDIKLDIVKARELRTGEKTESKMAERRRHRSAMITPFLKITQMEKPVIAAVNGYAIGGGCDLALACDIRIASENAKFGEFYIKRGLVPDLGGTYFLPRLVGMGRAKLMVFTGDLIDAKEAERIGLVEKVVPADELETTVNELARRLAKGPTLAIIAAKKEMHKAQNMTFEEALNSAIKASNSLILTEDFKEGYKAFLEKREPVYKGK
ncbi:MAG: enoyl-CoA hydratase [Candidatus Helarchaeota archaeon]|nr:enoyl-CoA hydratase [Candidatus Helarchaeota archaeon]